MTSGWRGSNRCRQVRAGPSRVRDHESARVGCVRKDWMRDLKALSVTETKSTSNRLRSKAAVGYNSRGRELCLRLTKAHEYLALLVPQAKSEELKAGQQGDWLDRFEKGICLMTLLKVVIRNARA